MLIHISDLHMGERASARLDAALAAINALAPDCIVLTGDVTHSGRQREFRLAASFLAQLRAPVVGAPGNHDAPVFNPALRLLTPFQRFYALGLLRAWDSACGLVSVRAFNSARAFQARSDWSQGVYAHDELLSLSRSFKEGAEHRVFVCHHPPHAPHFSPLRIHTLGAERALAQLSGTHLFLCGHLHRSAEFPAFGQEHLMVSTAPTLASARERGQDPGFRAMRFGAQRETQDWLWRDGHYAPHSIAHDHRQKRLA